MSKIASSKGRPSTASPPSRPFQCQWHEGCPKSFNRKSDLQRHYRIHTNERPYACDYHPCQKTFIQRSALTVHRRTHTGDKPHRCPYVGCEKCFSDSSSLARHRRIHTNDKPYICKNPRCRKAFCRKTTMTKHFRKEHPTESMEQEEDGDYSEFDTSENEHSLENDVDSSSSADYGLNRVKSETPSNAAASNYNANLWRLPAQTAQAPTNNAIKLERSLSGMSGISQQSATEPSLNRQLRIATSAFHPRSNTLPNSIPRSHSTDMAMWQSQPMASPTAMSVDGGPMSGISTPTSTPSHYQPSQTFPGRRPDSLQPVHDILLDEPQSYAQPPPQQYQPMPSQPQYHSQSQSFRDEMPPTPAPNQNVMMHFPSPMDGEPLPIEAYQVPIVNAQAYQIPNYAQGHIGMTDDPLDPYKEWKLEDSIYTQTPEAAISWIQ